MPATLALTPPPERLRDRLVARLRSGSLDTALANGTPADAYATLALRARRLTNLTRRRELADAIEHLVHDTRRTVTHWPGHVGPLPDRVTDASWELTVLAGKLAEPTPVAARGVAEALLLLTDGTGPLYNAKSGGSVRDSAASAAANLRPAA
ncbi:MAG TPA: hypothetical protein VKS25_12655 [Solirubrobacteraceae bacterium]|nr:hypothetical protein [Solirubrobacteraceae bacterium]